MGTKTVCQLDDLVDSWKQRARECESLRSNDILELEQHLRDSVDSLSTTGLDIQESFIVALHRIGNTDQLGIEFNKTNGGFVWSRRIFWMVGGYILLMLARLTIDAFVDAFQLVVNSLGLTPKLAAILGASLTVAIWLGLLRLMCSTASGSSAYLRTRIPDFSRWSAIWLSASILLVYVVAYASKLTSHFVMFRSLGTNDFSQMAIINAYFEAAWSPLLFLILVLTAASLKRRVFHPSTA